MQSKIRIVIAHKEHKSYYLSKHPTELTHDLDKAINFYDMADASEWMLNSVHAPIDHESYEYKQIKITKEVLDDERNDELLHRVSQD